MINQVPSVLFDIAHPFFLVRLFLKNDLSESKILLILFCVREQQIQSCSCALKKLPQCGQTGVRVH